MLTHVMSHSLPSIVSGVWTAASPCSEERDLAIVFLSEYLLRSTRRTSALGVQSNEKQRKFCRWEDLSQSKIRILFSFFFNDMHLLRARGAVNSMKLLMTYKNLICVAIWVLKRAFCKV